MGPPQSARRRGAACGTYTGMTVTATTPKRPSAWRGVWMLAAGQTLVWVSLYYSFAALLFTWEQDLGWSKADLTLGITLAVLVSALVTPLAGLVIDRGGGRLLLGGSALLGALALALLAAAESPLTFTLLWLVVGVAQGACLYEPCFSFVTKVMAGAARKAITRIALIAGFAGPIAFMSGALLAELLGWRGAVLVYAAVAAGLGAPLLYIGAGWVERAAVPGVAESRQAARAADRAALHAALRRPAFWLIGLAFPLMSVNHGMLLNHVVPLLVERGLTEALAVAAASLIGPMQVAGRVLMILGERRFAAYWLVAISFLGVFLAAWLLLAAGLSPLLAFAFAAVQGASYGVISILRPVIVAEFLGRRAFGVISGWLAVPYLLGFAAAPFLAALLWEAPLLGQGYDTVILAAAALATAGALAIAALRLTRPADA